MKTIEVLAGVLGEMRELWGGEDGWRVGSGFGSATHSNALLHNSGFRPTTLNP